MKPKVIITNKIPDSGLELLKNDFTVIILANPKDLEKEIADADYLISFVSDPITESLLEHAPKLKLISQYAVGYDNVDIKAVKKHNIPVTNTPDVLTTATAELTLGLILALLRRIVEGDRICRSNQEWHWSAEFLLGTELAGLTIGIIGLGRIALAVAKRALAFDMNVNYYSRTRNLDLERQYNFHYCSLDTLLAQSDIISLHLPYNSQTHHIISERELKLMKPTAFLINTSRGKHVDEQALINALESRSIAGAGVDVFYYDPYIPERLIRLPNVVLTPHIGSATKKARYTMATVAATSIISYHTEGKLVNLISELR